MDMEKLRKLEGELFAIEDLIDDLTEKWHEKNKTLAELMGVCPCCQKCHHPHCVTTQ